MVFSILIYFICLIAVFVFNLINTSYVPFILDIIFILISTVSFIIILILRHGVNAEFGAHDGNADRTLNSRIPVKIINNSFIPITYGHIKITIKYNESEKKKKIKLRFMCPAKSETEYHIVVKCNHCELITISMKKLYVFDYLHLFVLNRRIKINTELVVLPQMPDVGFLNMLSSEIGDDEGNIYSSVKAGDDPTEIFEIREYQGGDKIRNIHWKLSSKMNHMMVKEYGLCLHEQDTVIFELYKQSKKNKEIKDEMFDLLYGLTYAMTKRGFGFNVCYYNGTFVNSRIETQNDINSLFAELYKIEPYDGKVSCAEMYCTINNTVNHRIFYVTEFLNEDSKCNMRMLQSVGVVYYLIPGETRDSRMPVKFTEYERQ